eukprot:5849393-Prymnesium_polylepis.1
MLEATRDIIGHFWSASAGSRSPMPTPPPRRGRGRGPGERAQRVAAGAPPALVSWRLCRELFFALFLACLRNTLFPLARSATS